MRSVNAKVTRKVQEEKRRKLDEGTHKKQQRGKNRVMRSKFTNTEQLLAWLILSHHTHSCLTCSQSTIVLNWV